MGAFEHLEDIYDYDDACLSQFCYAEHAESDFVQWEVGEHIEDVDGAAAKKAIEEALNDGYKPVYANGYIMGYEDEDTAFIYTDCDDETYEEYYGEAYTAN